MAVGLTLLLLYYNYLFCLEGCDFKLYGGFYYRAVLFTVIKVVPAILELSRGYNNVLINIYIRLGRWCSCLYSGVLVGYLVVVDFNNL